MGIEIMQNWERASSELWVYVIGLGFIYVLYILRDYIRNVRFAFSLDGPATVPILGNANILAEDNMVYRMGHEALDYGRIFRVWLSVLPYVVIIEPEDIRVILNNTKHTEKVFFYRMLDTFLGKGLITMQVDTWKAHRRILQPAFHIHMLERFTKTFAECADSLATSFVERMGKEFNITSLVNDTVYDILMETVLGLKKNDRLTQDSMPAEDMLFRMGQVTVPYRLRRPWLLIQWIYALTKDGRTERKHEKKLFDACCKMMRAKRDMIRKKGSTINDNPENAMKKVSLLEYMVEANERNPCFTDEDIVDECCTFMLAGQESVGTATALTLFHLATHLDWQEKCVEELDQIFGEDPRPPSMQDFKDMRCLEMCIKETLRLYPSVPAIGRTLGEDVKLGKYVIPAGCGVFIVPYSTHRLPHLFPDPDSFKPERFTAENSENRHPYSFLPFSAGPRNCIGYKFAMFEMKAMISAVLRKCRLEPVSGKEKVRPKFRITIRAQGGLWVHIVPRRKSHDSP